MKTFLSSLALALMSASGVSAECYADYKAKQDTPLRLHYGVISISGPCDVESARKEATPRLAEQNWQLLNILAVFGPEGLEERRDSAGPYYLSF